MNQQVINGLEILSDIFKNHARYKDADGNQQVIALDKVGIQIDVLQSADNPPKFSLSFAFRDNAGKEAQASVLVPDEYTEKIDLIKAAIKRRTLDFDGC